MSERLILIGTNVAVKGGFKYLYVTVMSAKDLWGIWNLTIGNCVLFYPDCIL